MATDLLGCRILVVEDEYYLADDVKRVLSDLGAQIIGPVPTRYQAFQVIEQTEQVDVAILDVKLRDDSVLEVAKALRQRNIPFAFATGYDLAALPKEFRNVMRLEKAFTTKSLVSTLLNLLGRR